MRRKDKPFMKKSLEACALPAARKVAQQLDLTLVDVELVKESAGHFLRFYIDKPGGVTLDDCERFHKSVQPLVENVEYDYMEVASPGADRPLKRAEDFARAMGTPVEVGLYRALEGAKRFTGELSFYDGKELALLTDGGEVRLPMKLISQVVPVIEIDPEEIDRALGGVDDADRAE